MAINLDGFRVLSEAQVAEALGVGPGTIDQLYRTGRLPAVKVGRHLKFLTPDVRRYLEDLRESGA